MDYIDNSCSKESTARKVDILDPAIEEITGPGIMLTKKQVVQAMPSVFAGFTLGKLLHAHMGKNATEMHKMEDDSSRVVP